MSSLHPSRQLQIRVTQKLNYLVYSALMASASSTETGIWTRRALFRDNETNRSACTPEDRRRLIGLYDIVAILERKRVDNLDIGVHALCSDKVVSIAAGLRYDDEADTWVAVQCVPFRLSDNLRANIWQCFQRPLVNDDEELSSERAMGPFATVRLPLSPGEGDSQVGLAQLHAQV